MGVATGCKVVFGSRIRSRRAVESFSAGYAGAGSLAMNPLSQFQVCWRLRDTQHVERAHTQSGGPERIKFLQVRVNLRRDTSPRVEIGRDERDWGRG
jgi:hypothetical protein